MKNKKFQPGAVVVFDPSHFNPKYWDNLPEKTRKKYYGSLGYGQKKLKLFVFLCEINESGHCVLLDMDDQHIESMCHISDFRAATDEEF